MLATKSVFKSTRPNGIIGKKVGSNHYIHKSAITELNDELLRVVRKALWHLDNFEYEIIKIHTKEHSVSFIQSPNWDFAHEPLVGDSLKVTKEGETTHTKARTKNPQIYHHKWTFVRDDYQGFDVVAAKQRSEFWENSGIEIDRSRIGGLDHWIEHVLKPLGETNIVRVDRTSLKQTPALFKSKHAHLGPVNFDIGCGKFSELATAFLIGKGVQNINYDPYTENYKTNQETLATLHKKGVDTATMANVLNVVKDADERRGIIEQAVHFLKDNGTCYVYIYEGNRSGEGAFTSRMTWQENRKTDTYIEELSPYFFNIQRKGNMLICSIPLKNALTGSLKLQARQWRLNRDVFYVEGIHQF